MNNQVCCRLTAPAARSLDSIERILELTEATIASAFRLLVLFIQPERLPRLYNFAPSLRNTEPSFLLPSGALPKANQKTHYGGWIIDEKNSQTGLQSAVRVG